MPASDEGGNRGKREEMKVMKKEEVMEKSSWEGPRAKWY